MTNRLFLLLLLTFTISCTQVQEDGFFTKESTNTGLTCQNTDGPATSSSLTAKAIYGADNRLDWYNSPGLTKDYWARATLALIPTNNLVLDDDRYKIRASTYKESVNLCPGQPFADQPAAAFCSGFLVAEDLVVTAGHCVRDEADCSGVNFVFDFAKTEADQTEFSVPVSSVYSCDQVVVSSTGAEDFAVVRLDRAVVDRTPLNVRRGGSLRRGDQVMLVGHPMGLPSKIADGGFVQRVGETIEASVDAFAANSGSVILNSISGLVEGILVAGEVDFVYRDGCRVEAVCGANCDGEVITPISKVLRHIPDTIFENPICTLD